MANNQNEDEVLLPAYGIWRNPNPAAYRILQMLRGEQRGRDPPRRRQRRMIIRDDDGDDIDDLLVPIRPPVLAPPPQVPAAEVVQIECEISEELSAKVFENDMLREIILKHVIYSNGRVSPPDLKNVRLVRKSWLQTAVDSMQKFREPMFTLTLDNGPPKLLDEFVRAMASPTRLPDCIPPFSLKLMPEFFREENYNNLSECLVSCGESLINLDVIFPTNSSIALVFPSYRLPKLQQLTVQFSHQLLNDRSAVNLHQNNALIYPLQTILHATDQLTELVFKLTTSKTQIPFGFSYLSLPNTVTSLYLDCPVKNGDLELLMKNDLPNLTSLQLFSGNTPLSGETIFQILAKYRTRLRLLSLNGRHNYRRGHLRSTTFTFPVMEKLDALKVCSPCWELEDDLSRLESRLPKVSKLSIVNTKDSLFTKWTSNSRFEAVKSLAVSLVKVTGHVETQVPISINLARMRSLQLAFPNVVNLDVTICGTIISGLKCAFVEMRSLEKLVVAVKETRGNQFHPDQWDSVLIGLPPDLVASLRRNLYYVETVDLKDDNNLPSIRKLTCLMVLVLVDKASTSAVGDRSLITDLSFQLAFLKMPKLGRLLLNGRFSASVQMTEQWKQKKGTEIIYSGTPYL